MTIPKIFVASSTAAYPLAEELMKALDNRKVSCVPWKGSFDSGDYVIPRLKERAEECDFAAVFLTEDDWKIKKGKRDLSPRDNCIFELGFFMAALGRDHRRCFMLTTIAKETALPSDVAGRTYLRVSAKGKDRKPSIARAALEILKSVSEYRRLERGKEIYFITPEQLMKKERPEKMRGDLLVEQGTKSVVVNAAVPIERDYEIAKKVHANMTSGVTYEYFLGREDRNAVFVANLIQMLCMVGITKGYPEESQRVSLMSTNVLKVRDNLELLQGHMCIHFRKRPPLQFCVHNADQSRAAVCYLRYMSDDFIEWRRNEDAVAIADELTSSCTSKNQSVVFHSTADVKLAGDGDDSFRRLLREEVLKRFPTKLKQKADAACFPKTAQQKK